MKPHPCAEKCRKPTEQHKNLELSGAKSVTRLCGGYLVMAECPEIIQQKIEQARHNDSNHVGDEIVEIGHQQIGERHL